MLPSSQLTTNENKSEENSICDKTSTEFDFITKLFDETPEMSLNYEDETFMDLTGLGGEAITPPSEESFPVGSPVPQVADSPGFFELEGDGAWSGFPYQDLIGFGGKSDKFTPLQEKEEALIMTTQAVLGDINKGIGSNLDQISMDLPSFANITYPTDLQLVVAPMKVERKPVPGKSAQTATSHKRKETHFPLAGASSYSLEEVDVKPELSTAATPSSSNNGRGRKRVSSISAPPNSFTVKKPKKYEQDPAVDPTVKNARAAKANRERKKQEFRQFKEESEQKDALIRQLQERVEQSDKKAEQYLKERDEARESNAKIQGLRGVATNIREFIQCVIPPMNSAFGHMDVQIPEWFAGVSMDSGTITGMDASVHQRFDLAPNQDPSRYFTAHVNIPENTMKIEYNPRAGM